MANVKTERYFPMVEKLRKNAYFCYAFYEHCKGILTENKNILIDIFFTCIKYKKNYFNFIPFFKWKSRRGAEKN